MKTKSYSIKCLFALFAMLMGSALSVFAAALTPQQNDKGEWGYTDATGKWVVEPKYTTAEPFYNNFAIVSKDGKYGVVDENGKEKVKCKYRLLFTYDNGTFWAIESENSTTGKLYNLRERQTKNVGDIQITEVNDSNRIITGRYGIGVFYNKSNNTIYAKGFEMYSVETKGIYTVCSLTFNTGGHYTSQLYLGSGMQIPENNIVRDGNGKYGIFPFVPCEYDDIHKFEGYLGKFACVKDGRRGILKVSDSDYTTVIPCQYDSVVDYINTDYSAPYLDKKAGLYDIQGNMILQCEYDSIIANNSYSGYIFRCYKNNTMSIYRSSLGKTIIPAGIYKEYTGSLDSDKLITVKKEDGTEALFSAVTGKELVPAGKFVAFLAWKGSDHDCVIGIDKNDRQALVKADGTGKSSACIYKNSITVTEADGLYIMTGLNNKFTLIDEDINIILKDYDEIVKFGQNVIIFRRNGKIGASYYNGTQCVAPKYDDYVLGDKRLGFMNATSSGFIMYVYNYDGTLFTTRAFRNSQYYEAQAFTLDYLYY